MNSIEAANQLKLESVALPAISSGIFGFPKHLCAKILFNTIQEYFETRLLLPKKASKVATVKDIRFVNLDQETVDIFVEEFDRRHYFSEYENW